MSRLLLVDALINLLLGVLLLLFPEPFLTALGLPGTDQVFYPSILGAVLFGIGIALLIQLKSNDGLGLLGAVAINLCGGIALAYWLLFGRLSLPDHGISILWALVIVLLGLSTIELLTHRRGRSA
jgi:hypothetical protein